MEQMLREYGIYKVLAYVFIKELDKFKDVDVTEADMCKFRIIKYMLILEEELDEIVEFLIEDMNDVNREIFSKLLFVLDKYNKMNVGGSDEK